MSLLKRNVPLSTKHAFIVLSIVMSFFSMQGSLIMYMNSSYLKHAIMSTHSFATMPLWHNPDNMVGTIYTIASLISLLLLFAAPRILGRFGNYRWTLSLVVVQTILLIGLAIFDSAWFIIPIFIVQTALAAILYFNFDIFLEYYSSDNRTGLVRGIIEALTSLAWLFPPLIAGAVVDRFGFPLIYLLGAAFLAPTIFILMRYMSNFSDMPYEKTPLWIPTRSLAQHPDIVRIYRVNFFLQFFYAWMIIYVPIYLHDTLGVTYGDIGILLTIALTAFVIFPYFEGVVADRFLGEKEMLVAGFFLMGVSSFGFSYFSGTPIGLWGWGLLLFVGRTGAATIETLSQVYFFKQVNGRDASLIAYFRRATPLAYIVAPLAASLLLGFGVVDLKDLFYVLAFIMLGAIYLPLRLKDTL